VPIERAAQLQVERTGRKQRATINYRGGLPLTITLDLFSTIHGFRMNPLDIKELPLSSKARICWGFFWRGIVVTLGSTLCGGLLGGIVGFILGFAGTPKAAPIVGGALGAVTAAFFMYLFVRWLLSSRLGDFRLVLVHAQEKI
jgi:hypothetical protein